MSARANPTPLPAPLTKAVGVHGQARSSAGSFGYDKQCSCQGKRERVRGGEGKGTKLEDRLRTVESVIVQYERTIHTLEDRCSLVIQVRETAHQQKIQEYRDLHRRQGDDIKKKDHAALHAAQKAGQHPPGRAAHPLGSQRSLLLTYVLNEINAVAPAGTEGSAAVKEMLTLQTAQLDEFFVRLKAKHASRERAGRGCGR